MCCGFDTGNWPHGWDARLPNHTRRHMQQLNENAIEFRVCAKIATIERLRHAVSRLASYHYVARIGHPGYNDRSPFWISQVSPVDVGVVISTLEDAVGVTAIEGIAGIHRLRGQASGRRRQPFIESCGITATTACSRWGGARSPNNLRYNLRQGHHRTVASAAESGAIMHERYHARAVWYSPRWNV